MMQKFIALIELWIGLGFFIALLAFIPVINIASDVLSGVIGAISKIPFYSGIMAIFGSILFFDGLMKLVRH